ncbi:UNVERIFIED_CONTAM: hypothetical protein FKN15_020190 [Acipenser sinensis]
MYGANYFKGTLGLQPGDSALFINGLHIDLDVQDIFSVFDTLRNEARVMEGLRSLLIETSVIHDILKLNVQPSDSDYAVDIRNPAIYWINNLETDSRYDSWPSSVQELLRPTFPGVIRQIRKNFHNFVIIVDPTGESTAELINVVEMFFNNHIPLRIGLVFVVDNSEDIDGLQDTGVALLRAFNYISEEMDNQHAFQAVTAMYNKVRTGEKLKVENVISVLEKKYPYVEVSSILGADSVYDRNRKEGRSYYEQTGVGPLPVALYNGMPYQRDQLDADELETVTMHKILETTSFYQRAVYLEGRSYYEQTGVGPLPVALYNGMPYQREQLDADELETVTMHKILETTSFYQRAVYLGELTTDQDVVDFVMNQPNVVPRINSRILSTTRQYIDFSKINSYFVDDYARFTFLDTKEKTAAVANSMNYLTKKDDTYIRPVTFWIVGDFDQPSGRQLLYDSIKHMKSSNNVRIGMVNNPAEKAMPENSHIARAIWAAIQTQTANNAKNFITKLSKEDTAEAVESGADVADFAVGGMDISLFKSAYDSPKVDFLLSHAAFCRDVLKLKKGQRAVISNGRIIGPLEDGEVFNQDDFLLLESIILKTSGERIRSKIEQLGIEDDRASDLVMKVDALLSSQPKGDARIEYNFFEDRYRHPYPGRLTIFTRDHIIFTYNYPFIQFGFYWSNLGKVPCSRKSSNNVRIGMVNNPAEKAMPENSHIARAIWAAIQTQTANNAKNFITKLSKEDTAEAVESGADVADFAVGGMDIGLFKSAYDSPKVDFLLSHSAFCRDVLKLKKGQRAVISNGRIIGPLEDGEVFNQDDFLLLESIILKTSGERIRSKIEQLRIEEDRASDLVMKVDALLSSQPKGDGRIEYNLFEDRYSAVKVRPKEEEVYFDVVAIMDPATRAAQKLAPLLTVLSQLINMNLRVFMNCQSKLSDLPLKSFYRYVLEPEIAFMVDNSFAPGPIAKFLDMPHSPLFTLNVNPPESWMVESVKTRYDLDNIYLEEVESMVAAEYELEYLLLEGHAYDVSSGQPPRGLQFTLGTASDPVIVDTIVMANLVQKKSDKINEELLSDRNHDNDSGFWESLTRGFTGGAKPDEVRPEKDDVINIFSVASGHLYERFLRIMMLSVLKHTKTPVKFWFLKNYLSPAFKIVRTDLKELRDFDLEGAPYGYTPFCESRSEMDGYRFWKSGYWASHLAGRKYHISALYVVDLKKFRKIAAGDRLRGQFQGLSQDPNSLSNLDQDLPNNMIHQVPIKSLPQEWLWCETWCDEASKKWAKTIDLCNNPQTKEPKLQAAVRIVGEWSEYDQEIKKIYNKFTDEKEKGAVPVNNDTASRGKAGHSGGREARLSFRKPDRTPTGVDPQPGPLADPKPGILADPKPGILADPELGLLADPEPELRVDLEPFLLANPEPGPVADPEPGLLVDLEPGPLADPDPGPLANPEVQSMANPLVDMVVNPDNEHGAQYLPSEIF